MPPPFDSESIFATTLASIGDGVIATDAAGRVTFINAEAERLTQWTRADAVGRPLASVFAIVNEDTGEPAENPVERVLREGKAVGLANHSILIRRDGARTPIADSAAPIRRDDGPVIGVVLVFRDVAEQRAAAIAEARLAAIVRYSGDAIVTKNLDGIIESWNAGAEHLFGYRAEEAIGQPITMLVPPDRLDEEAQILDRLRKGQPVERLETIRVAKDGRNLNVWVNVSPILDRDGRVIGASKILHDITERLAAREALNKERELLATTLASIGDAVIVTDAAGRVTSLNPRAERLTGWTSAEARGEALTSVFRIVNEETRATAENPVDKALRLGNVVGLANHTVLVSRTGEEWPIDDSAAPIRHADGSVLGVVLVFHDIAERRRSELALQAADRRKDEFLAVLSHELRNPLAPIRMAVTMLQQIGPADPRLQESRNVIDRQTRQLTRLLDDLLDIGRIASGKITLRTDRMSLILAVTDAIEAARPNLESLGQTLDVQLPDESIEVEGDLGRLAQVFSNLLNNASKYSDRDSRITVQVERDAGTAVVRIIDTGFGLTAEQLSTVFEMFTQVSQPRGRDQGGLGVGLWLAKTFVDQHHGSIEARSEGPGRGSQFIVRLPVLERRAHDAAPVSAEPVAAVGPSRRVLVADDNIDGAAMLAEVLRLADHEVRIAHDGHTAVEMAIAFRPDVAILDIGMPGLNGYEAARRLRKEFGAALRLVAVTGWGQHGDRRRAMEAGFDLHLTKPIELSQLRRALHG